ncbi:MAG TPA: metallophosphoesterase, partial [Solirubrobacter sp.]|nr:metallophosphoesterase [Solirubrobacter sp.]
MRRSGTAPNAVLVTGDIADHGSGEEYAVARELLERLRAPVYALPGNHDRRGALRRHFDVPGAGDDPIRYTADLGPLRLVVLDSTIPGEDAGALGAEQLRWLD